MRKLTLLKIAALVASVSGRLLAVERPSRTMDLGVLTDLASLIVKKNAPLPPPQSGRFFSEAHGLAPLRQRL